MQKQNNERKLVKQAVFIGVVFLMVAAMVGLDKFSRTEHERQQQAK